MEQLERVIASISQSIAFDSSRKAAQPGMPFGKGAYDCLCHFLSLAGEMGFSVRNYDGYAGEVVFGAGEPFAVLAHLDVVPAGQGWTKDPFGGTVSEGRIWGRGAIDDKGPALCALYAMKALKDRGFVPKKTIKLIVGCNEEDGWECIEYYKRHAELPRTGFSPDADFPVIYAEKGILHVLLHFPVDNAPFSELRGGTSANMVCAHCTAKPNVYDGERAKKYRLGYLDSMLTAVGKSAHGSTPACGINAIEPILRYFGEENAQIQHIVTCAFDDIYGLKKLNDDTGFLTLSPDIVSYGNGTVDLLCDIRYPSGYLSSEITALLDKFGAPYEVVHEQAPLYQYKNGSLVQTLLSVYEDCTGEKAEPVAIGGGTYARALENGVAFGPERKGDEPVVHQADEYISVDRVKLLLEVYEKALERLCG